MMHASFVAWKTTRETTHWHAVRVGESVTLCGRRVPKTREAIFVTRTPVDWTPGHPWPETCVTCRWSLLRGFESVPPSGGVIA